MIKDSERAARGLPIGYIDRVRSRIPELLDAEPEVLWRLPLPTGLQTAAAKGDWSGFWSQLNEHPAGLISLAAYATAGAVRDGQRVWGELTGKEPQSFIFGRLRAASRNDGIPTALIEVPQKNGSKVLEIRFKGALEDHFRPGDAIRVQQRRSENGIYYRLAPGAVPSTVEPGGKRIASMGATEVAAIVRAQYGDHPFMGDWDRVDITESLKRINPKVRTRKFGLYQHRDTGDAVLVFRGTHPLNPVDWGVNVATTHGLLISDYAVASDVSQWARQQFGSLMVAGHSKGAGVAQYISAKMGLRAVCFNGVGLPNQLIETLGVDPAKANVDHFAVRRDWVSNVGGIYRTEGMGIAGPSASIKSGQKMLGTKESFHFLDTPYSAWRCLSLHGINTVINALERDPHIVNKPFEQAKTLPAVDRVESLRDAQIAAKDRLPTGRQYLT